MALMLACGYTYGIHPARMTCAHIMSSSTPDAIAHRIGPHPVADGGEDGARFEALRIALREGSRGRWHDYSTLKCARTTASHIRHRFNDRIATQRYSSPEIPIGSRVMSRTTSALIGRRSRKMVANVAGCRSFCTFRDFHTSIAFTPVGPQPNLAHIFGWIWD